MHNDALIQQLIQCQKHFDNSSGCLQEQDSTFAPVDGMRTVAQQVAHAAHTIDWFVEGFFGSNGFDLDFAKFDNILVDVNSLEGARKWLDEAFKTLQKELSERPPEEMEQTLPEGPVMGGAPRSSIVYAVIEHTSHHRGALTVYARLRGYTPGMPYEG